jgi:Domain of unknown function (DUF1992)
MTERKPPDISFTTWIDQQINEAAAQGAFDDLPGAGKPLPGWGQDDDGQSWLRDKLRREGVSTEAMLPTPLKLRKEKERLSAAAPLLASEQEVRAAAAELNQRILEWRRIPVGPDIFVPLADADALAARWREARPAGPAPAGPGGPADPPAAGPRWWHRLSRR